MKRLAPRKFYATGLSAQARNLSRRPRVSGRHDHRPLSNLSEDLTLAARDALLQMVDWLHGTSSFARAAYVLSSVAVDLRIANVVDTPISRVSAILDLGVFDRGRGHDDDDDDDRRR